MPMRLAPPVVTFWVKESRSVSLSGVNPRSRNPLAPLPLRCMRWSSYFKAEGVVNSWLSR